LWMRQVDNEVTELRKKSEATKARLGQEKNTG
jgi:hypothetical protein